MYGSRPQGAGRDYEAEHSDSPSNNEKYVPAHGVPTKDQLRRATRTRKIFQILTSFLLLVAVVFLILVELGITQINSPILQNIYFIKLDFTNVVPQSVPNNTIINSIARTLGLHDFYKVGLWNFCEGYNDEGVTFCSTPQTLYWFNPVQIILNELLAGATIALPGQVTDILNLIKLVSQWMFGLFLSSAVLSFVLIFTAPFSVYSRWVALFNAIFTVLSTLFVFVAGVIATVMFQIMQTALTSQQELNIKAQVGVQMFVFIYIAFGATLLAAIIQLGSCCCCASRRDVKSGRKSGSAAAWR